MEIRRRPANTFIDRLYCDCGQELYSAEMQMTHPPKYLHRCKKCSFSWADPERYPCLRHEEYGDIHPDVVVHHKNENKMDNRIDNLEISSLSEHTRYHSFIRHQSRDRSEDGRYLPVGLLKKNTESVVPTKKHFQDAGLDISSVEDGIVSSKSRKSFRTGLSLAVPLNHVGLLYSRSGLSVKNGIEVGAGCIDASYRGEIQVILYNHSDSPFEVKKGDRIAQLLTIPIYLNEYKEVDSLSETTRGGDGFGSTGVRDGIK